MADSNPPRIAEALSRHRCPLCGGDRADPGAIATMQRLCRVIPLTAESVNPGGRELTFVGLGRLQLADQCVVCDLGRLQAFLGEAS